MILNIDNRAIQRILRDVHSPDIAKVLKGGNEKV
jgi:flagellar motor switch protein FliG